MRYLGIQLSNTIDKTVDETFNAIHPKAIQRKILATSVPTDLLHRATLIKAALTPIYNHVLMAIPSTAQQMKSVFEKVTSFLWTRTQDGETKQKRILVAKKRISAPLNMGGLSILHPQTIAQSFQLNFLQRIFNKELGKLKIFSATVEKVLMRVGRPTMPVHVGRIGPLGWAKTAKRVKKFSPYLAESMETAEGFLKDIEKNEKTWYLSPLFGHSLSAGIYAFTEEEGDRLAMNQIITVGQLFEPNPQGFLTNDFRHELSDQIQGFLLHKLKYLFSRIKNSAPQLKEARHSFKSWLDIYFTKTGNISRVYNNWKKNQLVQEIKIPPAFATRERDGIPVPSENDFKNAYLQLKNPLLSSKTKENSFNVLNRTLWSKKKAFLSGIATDPDCPFCGQPETTEHMLADCDAYAYERWKLLAKLFTAELRERSGKFLGSVMITFNNIFYNKEISNLKQYTSDVQISKVIKIVIHETRRDIYAKRISHPPSDPGPVLPIRIIAHTKSVLKKIKAFLVYTSLSIWQETILFLEKLIDTDIELD